MPLEVVVLAAGQGKRMRSARPKVLQPLAGRPLLDHVVAAARALEPARIHIVVGHGADQVQAAFDGADDLSWVVQAEQRGTGHAVSQALPAVDPAATLLVLYGDVPLVRAETLRACIGKAHDGLALVTVAMPDPTGLGRIVRDATGAIEAIVEEKDATPAQRAIDEINSGIMAMPAALARDLVARLDDDNASREYLLTDIIALAVADGVPVRAQAARQPEEVAGLNDRIQLAGLERHYQRERAEALMRAGVSFADPARVDIRGELDAGQDCFVDVNAVFEGRVELGRGVHVGAGAVIRDALIGDDVVIEPYTVIDGATIGTAAELGPFARLRPGTELAERVKIGNFVEVKKARLGAGSKANHLAYLGDAELGADCNVGAGSITCNYDGVDKHFTRIGNGVFLGSNSTLVAPIDVADGAYVAAGSTITHGVRPKMLAVGRARQRNIDGWKPPAARSERKN